MSAWKRQYFHCEICEPGMGGADSWPATEEEEKAALEKAHVEKLKATGLDLADFLASVHQDGPPRAPASRSWRVSSQPA